MTPRIYLDSVVVIYLIEQNPTFVAAVQATLARLGGAHVTSELARMEALVLPVRLGDSGRVKDFEDFFGSPLVELREITRPVFDRAIHIRAAHPGFKTPDSLHLAAAVEANCDVFVTNDPQLRQYAGIRVELV